MLNSKTIDISNLNDLRQWVKSWVPTLKERQVILLEGVVGAGKTQLIQFVCEELKFNPHEVASPSYAIHHRYENSKYSLDHVDLYRLESEDDLESTGFWDLFSQDRGYIFIEWADYIDRDQLPPNWPKVLLEIEYDSRTNSRKLKCSTLS